MDSSITLRAARPDDAAALLEIYAPYVTGTAITFEYDAPSVEEFRARIEHTLKKYPYIVAESGGEIVGYAYTGEFKERAAYGWSVETSIYVARGKKHCGIGKRLYRALEDISRLQNILNLNACIAYPHEEDEYLTKNSVQFHEHLGYSYIGEFHNSGYKFGRWYGMVWMEKLIGAHTNSPAAVIPFAALDADKVAAILR